MRIWDLRLRVAGDREVACLLRGDLVGAAPAEGDLLRVEGAFREGTFHIQDGVNHTTGARLAPRSSGTGWVLAVTTGILGLLALYLSGRLDGLLDRLLTPIRS